MKITLDSPVNKYYVQTLSMIFFPGEHFGEKEEDNAAEAEPRLYVHSEESDGTVSAHVKVEWKEKVCEADYSAEQTEGRTKERTLKLAVGGAVLAALGELMEYRPAWGMMIGVRPSKVASEMLNSGISKTRVKKILNSDYLVIPKKAALATEIAVTEKKIVGNPSLRDCSVYISIPFCPSRCTYCSFVSYTSKKLLDLIPQYLQRLKEDILENFALIDRLGLRVRTVYIGGGTPTILSEEQLRDLLRHIASLTDVSALEEYTLEAGRPDTITAQKMQIAKEYGVTRVSVNPQSLCDEVLCGVGRNHSVSDFYRAFEDARNAGLKTVNVDLIAGLPGDNFRHFSATMDGVIALKPQNLTVHTFCVKKSAEIRQYQSDVYSIRGGDVGKCVDYSQIKAHQAGYIPYYMYRQKNTVGNYENVGFSMPGHEGLYNIYMMEEIHSIFSAGAGSVTKLVDSTGACTSGRSIERLFNQKYPYEYLAESRSQSFAAMAEKFYREHGML